VTLYASWNFYQISNLLEALIPENITPNGFSKEEKLIAIGIISVYVR